MSHQVAGHQAAGQGAQAPFRLHQRNLDNGSYRIVQNADGTQNVLQQQADGQYRTVLRRGQVCISQAQSVYAS